MKSSTNWGGHCANPLFSAFMKALLPVMLLLVGNVAVKAQTDVTFDPNVRYSQLVLDSHLGDFYGSTYKMGFATYDKDLKTDGFPDSGWEKTVAIDYVAGLVAKATLEAAILYKDYDWSMPWFKSVESYANHSGVSAPTEGGNLDNLNGAKMYFGLKTLAEGKFKSIAESTTASNAATQLGNALTGLVNYNKPYKLVNKKNTGGYAFPSNTTVSRDGTSYDVSGGWFHKSNYINQMWLDGQYMGPALLAQLINDYSEYSSIAGSVDADWDLIAKQFTIVWNMCWDESAGLLYHAFSSEANSTWTDDAEIWTTAQKDNSKWTSLKKGGHSAAFWGRAEGWYFLALVDVLEQMPKTNANYATLKGYLDKLAVGIKNRQNATNGCWYQLIGQKADYSAQYYGNIDQEQYPYTARSNYPESSCTAIFTAAYLKAMRLGLLDRATYEETAKSGYKGLVETFMKQSSDGKTVGLYGCSRSAGLGTAEKGNTKFRDGSNAYYLFGYDVTPTTASENQTEGKVLGAFILAATEYERQYTNVTNKLVKIATDLNPTTEENTPLKVTLADTENSNVAYQWYKGTYNESTAITDATSAEYTPAESGTYYCKITVTPVTRSTDSYSLMSSETVVGASSTGDNTGDNTTTTKYEIWFGGTADAANNNTQSTFFSNVNTGTKDKGSNTINIGGVDYTVTGATETSTSITFTIEEGQTGNLSMFVSSSGSSRTITLTKTGETTGTSKDVSGTTLTRVDFLKLTSGTYTLSFSGKVHIGLLAMELVGGSTQNPDPAPTDKYTVTYNMNNHGVAIDAVKDVTMLPATLPAPTATGYTFEGWYLDAKFTNKAVDGATITKNTTLYAKWTINKYTVTPSATNGTISINDTEVISATSYDYGTKLVFKATPANGYEFESWTIEGTQGTEAADHTYTIASLDKDTKVTATFKKIETPAPTSTTYKIWFANDDDNTTGKEQVANNYFGNLSKGSNSFNKSGAEINIDGLGTYSVNTRTGNQTSLSFSIPDGSTGVFYLLAQSTGESRTLTLKKGAETINGAEKVLDKNSVAQQVKYTGLLPGDYSLTSSGNIQIGCICLAITGGSASKAYTIKYDLKGLGTEIPEATANDGKIVLPKTDPTAEGYTFGGWYKDEACTEENKVDGGEAISDNITLYAKWTRNTYTVTTSCAETNGTITVTDADGKDITNLDLTKVEHGTKLVFTATAEEGYKFDSWTVNEKTVTESGSTYTIESLDANTTITANFSAEGTGVSTTGTYSRSDMDTFGGRAGEVSSISKDFDGATTTNADDAVLTLTTTSGENVLALGKGDGSRTKVGGSFTIKAKDGYTIRSIELITNQSKSRLFTSNPTATINSSGRNHTYTYTNGAKSVTFTNNATGNIDVYAINVLYEFVSEKTPMTITFPAQQIEGYVGDNNVALPTPVVKVSGKEVTEGYTIEYKSNNEAIAKLNADNTVNLIAEGTTVVTATVKPTDTETYIGGSAAVTVVSKPIPALAVNVANVLMNSTDNNQAAPKMSVMLGEKELTATDYTITYEVKEGTNVTVTADNKLQVDGSAGNWTAGTSKIVVTVTPTETFAAENKCKAGSAEFTFTVNKAGDKLVPVIDFPDEISLGLRVDNVLKAYALYNGTDITDLFEFTYSIVNAGTTNGAKFKDTSTGAFYTGTKAGDVKIKIAVKPLVDFEEQYDVAEKEITIHVKELGKLTIESLKNMEVNVGEVIDIPELTLKDANGNIVSVDDVTITINSSSPSNVAVDQAAGTLRALSAGSAKIVVLVTSADYQDANTSFTVTVKDNSIYTVTKDQPAPDNGDTVEDVPGVTMTYGGWVFKPSLQSSVLTDKTLGATHWNTGRSDDAGSLPNFPYAIMGNDHSNPIDEVGANCAPEGTTVDFNGKNYTMIDKMFCVPADGAYFSFAPKTNGRVIVHILQNGVFDNDTKSGSTTNKPVYKPNRRVFVIDETGTRIPDEKIEAHLDITTGKMPKAKSNATINGASVTKDKPIEDIRAYKTDNKDASGKDIYLTADYKFSDDIAGLNIKFSGDKVSDFVNGLYRRVKNTGKDELEGGWVVASKAPVTYSFDAKAGKTYYLYCFGSKISLYGYEFKPATVKVDKVGYSETDPNTTITPTADGYVSEVSIDREFVPGIWNACVLPFSLNKQQVDAIFGQTSDNNNPAGTQILYFDHTEGSTIHFVRHAYNTIVAGKPFLIKPTKTDGTIKIAPENMGDSKYVTIESTPAENFGKDKDNASYYWTSSYAPFTVAPGDYFLRDAVVNGKPADGKVVRYPKNQPEPLEMNGFRGYLTAKSDALRQSAKSLTIAFNDFENNETTYIENVEIADDGTLRQRLNGKVYNLQGQLVSDDASQLDSLPKGIYIVNGTKVSVK